MRPIRTTRCLLVSWPASDTAPDAYFADVGHRFGRGSRSAPERGAGRRTGFRARAASTSSRRERAGSVTRAARSSEIGTERTAPGHAPAQGDHHGAPPTVNNDRAGRRKQQSGPPPVAGGSGVVDGDAPGNHGGSREQCCGQSVHSGQGGAQHGAAQSPSTALPPSAPERRKSGSSGRRSNFFPFRGPGPGAIDSTRIAHPFGRGERPSGGRSPSPANPAAGPRRGAGRPACAPRRRGRHPPGAGSRHRTRRRPCSPGREPRQSLPVTCTPQCCTTTQASSMGSRIVNVGRTVTWCSLFLRRWRTPRRTTSRPNTTSPSVKRSTSPLAASAPRQQAWFFPNHPAGSLSMRIT